MADAPSRVRAPSTLAASACIVGTAILLVLLFIMSVVRTARGRTGIAAKAASTDPDPVIIITITTTASAVLLLLLLLLLAFVLLLATLFLATLLVLLLVLLLVRLLVVLLLLVAPSTLRRRLAIPLGLARLLRPHQAPLGPAGKPLDHRRRRLGPRSRRPRGV